MISHPHMLLLLLFLLLLLLFLLFVVFYCNNKNVSIARWGNCWALQNESLYLYL